jgi:hypothetical protein
MVSDWALESRNVPRAVEHPSGQHPSEQARAVLGDRAAEEHNAATPNAAETASRDQENSSASQPS